MSARSSTGFILPLTLWIVAIMGLVIAAVDVWVQTAVANARGLRDKVDAQLATADIRNELIYALAMRPKSYRGLEVGAGLQVLDNQDFMSMLGANMKSSRAIAFDSRPYVMEGRPDYVIRLQDGRGLFQLNYTTPEPLRRFLGAMNLPEDERNRLADTLVDYVDEDSFTRLAGAEAPEYRRLGLPEPSNEPLLTPYEARRAFGWASAKDLWEADFRTPILTTCQSAGFNPNTAPAQVLLAQMPRLSAEAVRRLIDVRKGNPIASQAELASAAGELVYDEAFFYSFIPGECTIVDVFNRNSKEYTRFSITLRPINRVQPWRYDYELGIPAQYALDAGQIDGTALFPAPESLHSDADGKPQFNVNR